MSDGTDVTDGEVEGPLTVAVTGGIGSGKSTLAALLAERGALVVDSDQLARQVVAPGSPGLAEVEAAFGPGVICADGTLNRAALATIVFDDQSARATLEGITHPRVRAEFANIRAGLAADRVLVNDIPLLTTLAAAARFHLVIGVGASEAVKLPRLMDRGMTEADARSRIAAQISDDERRPLCDEWVDNDGSSAELRREADVLWARLRGFADNRAAGRRAPRSGPVLVPFRQEWAVRARLLSERISGAIGGARVDQIGSTAIPDMPAKDVIDLQLTVPDLAAADRWAPALAAAGFPLLAGFDQDTPHPAGADPAQWGKRLHVNADPGQSVNLHLRVRDSPNWRFALLFPAWLRADRAAADQYLAVKGRLADHHGGDSSIAGYAEAKEPWIASMYSRALEWAERTGWSPGD